MDSIFDKINVKIGILISIMTYFFGEHWVIFAGYFCANILDWATGWIKSKILKKESSKAGLIGIIKKLGYWIMIMVAFGSCAIFIEIGNVIGVNLGISKLLGWFVLASLLVNEVRSILENLVESGFNVPKILIDGLEVADKLVNKENEKS